MKLCISVSSDLVVRASGFQPQPSETKIFKTGTPCGGSSGSPHNDLLKDFITWCQYNMTDNLLDDTHDVAAMTLKGGFCPQSRKQAYVIRVLYTLNC